MRTALDCVIAALILLCLVLMWVSAWRMLGW